MNKIIIILMLIGIALTSNAHTFQVTDVVFNERTPEARIQRKKNQMLGQQLQITVFDKDIQLQTLDKSGKSDGKPYTIQRQSDGTYIFKRDAPINPAHLYIATCIKTVDKVMGYYRSLKLEVCENQYYIGHSPLNVCKMSNSENEGGSSYIFLMIIFIAICALLNAMF